MTSLSSREVYDALASKGFRNSNTDHKRLILYINGGKTGIHTKISHGPQHDIHDGLIARMKKQLRLSKSQFLDLIKCPLSYDDYVDILRNNNQL